MSSSIQDAALKAEEPKASAEELPEPTNKEPVASKPTASQPKGSSANQHSEQAVEGAEEDAAKKAAAGARAAEKAAARRKRRRIRRRKAAIAAAKELHNREDGEVVIRFDHVTKVFNLYKNDRGRFLGFFNINKKGQFLGSVRANDDLSFEIRKGESVAFLGLNGAGKSTALKMITGVMFPTSGTVEVKGRVSALLELTAGFDPKLTGRENVYLRGQILGMSYESIDKIMPEVEEFADLGLYFDQPMKSYSSGMRARLGFAFAVAVNPEILVVDEALSVGDRAFRRKCQKRIREIMMNADVTVLFVTHSSNVARQFCNRGIVLEKGTKVFEGPIEEATAYYEASV